MMLPPRARCAAQLAALAAIFAGCSDSAVSVSSLTAPPSGPVAPGDADAAGDAAAPGDATAPVVLDDPLEPLPDAARFALAGGCYAVGDDTVPGEEPRWLRATADGAAFAFNGARLSEASAFTLKASALGTYLLYDDGGAYLASELGPLERLASLRSDVYLVDDGFVSEAEWEVEPSERRSARFQLRSRRTGRLLGPDGLSDSLAGAAALVLEPTVGCAEHPEASLDASGAVTRTTFGDGELFGFVDTHSHILTNFAFGGGGVFHGAPFHRLGVEHALGSCEPFHGIEGRADMLSWGFAGDFESELDPLALAELLATGLLPEFNHGTDGWPTFSDWPSYHSSTHQTQYYRWLERAWMAGLRLVVQHAVSNEALCSLLTDTGFQPARYGCEDMRNIDRQLVEIRNMERYIDAQRGGPGEGWFRVVESPAEAREVIASGKLAIVLGIEVPNLFDCYLTPRPGGPVCDAAHVEAQLDYYHGLGVRALFPNHKYDNAFTPGDGHKGIFELGSFIQSGHWSNYVQDCPDVSTVFDKGSVQFGGLNFPREEYLSRAPNPPIQFTEAPLADISPYLAAVLEPPLRGEWCQKAGLTAAGVALIQGMMKRGMIVELDHLPRRSYLDVFELLAEASYPAAGTHGNTHRGQLYTELAGMSKTGFDRCADSTTQPGAMAKPFRDRRDARVAAGLHPSEGFGFDLNGFAGLPGPRFGPDSSCSAPQDHPIEYPFTSYGGDVTFTEPFVGQRALDFDTEGMVHIGLVAELIEDARRTGVSDDDLELLFRSAEGYIRMWERAEARAASLR